MNIVNIIINIHIIDITCCLLPVGQRAVVRTQYRKWVQYQICHIHTINDELLDTVLVTNRVWMRAQNDTDNFSVWNCVPLLFGVHENT